MRIALVSDLHANREAVDAVAKDAADQRVDAYWCLGDVVGYGGQPREVLEWAERECEVLVKGNHDQAVAAGDTAWFNDAAAGAARLHAQLLDPAERGRIYAWPHEARRSVDGLDVLLVHGSPDDPLREYLLPADAAAAARRFGAKAGLLLAGHTHVAFAASRAPGWRYEGFAERPALPDGAPFAIVNPGSVGQPRDGDPRASYAVLDTAARVVELRRVAYDVEAAAEAIRRAGLHASLAMRLYRGR